MDEELIKVYIKIDTASRVIDCNSSVFVRDNADWIQIDEWTEGQDRDKFALAQNNYFNKPLEVKPGIYRYKYVSETNAAEERTTEEIQSDSIEAIKSNKKKEVSQNCQSTIYVGYDVETSKGTKHFSLTIEDQTNLNGAYNAVLQGAEAYPYHADGELCEMYSAEDIKTMSTAAVAFKLYHVTYCNHLNVWINRSETADEIKAIYYGIELPEDLKANFELIIGAQTTENETVS
ncbi:MAG: hypothetical protein VB018_04035 [Lachnospiraceae bacterium]|nr:hypothetical protein [Lachnospiraceae bacterium]